MDIGCWNEYRSEETDIKKRIYNLEFKVNKIMDTVEAMGSVLDKLETIVAVIMVDQYDDR